MFQTALQQLEIYLPLEDFQEFLVSIDMSLQEDLNTINDLYQIEQEVYLVGSQIGNEIKTLEEQNLCMQLILKLSGGMLKAMQKIANISPEGGDIKRRLNTIFLKYKTCIEVVCEKALGALQTFPISFQELPIAIVNTVYSRFQNQLSAMVG